MLRFCKVAEPAGTCRQVLNTCRHAHLSDAVLRAPEVVDARLDEVNTQVSGRRAALIAAPASASSARRRWQRWQPLVHGLTARHVDNTRSLSRRLLQELA